MSEQRKLIYNYAENGIDTEHIISGISKIRNSANSFLEEELSKCNLDGFVASHGAILSRLFENGGKLTMSEIAKYVGKDKSTVTGLIEKLDKSGYISKVKSNEDKRVTFIVLTDKSWGIRDNFNKISDDLIRKAFENFTNDEQKSLVLLLSKMLMNFEK